MTIIRASMYTIFRTYNNHTCITETADNIINIFGACAIYADDPDLSTLKVWNTETGELIVNYMKGD